MNIRQTGSTVSRDKVIIISHKELKELEAGWQLRGECGGETVFLIATPPSSTANST